MQNLTLNFKNQNQRGHPRIKRVIGLLYKNDANENSEFDIDFSTPK